jgi:hypothetical protein
VGPHTPQLNQISNLVHLVLHPTPLGGLRCNNAIRRNECNLISRKYLHFSRNNLSR